jgi:hypothetical protein
MIDHERSGELVRVGKHLADHPRLRGVMGDNVAARWDDDELAKAPADRSTIVLVTVSGIDETVARESVHAEVVAEVSAEQLVATAEGEGEAVAVSD